jgi:hypothetical protein
LENFAVEIVTAHVEYRFQRARKFSCAASAASSINCSSEECPAQFTVEFVVDVGGHAGQRVGQRADREKIRIDFAVAGMWPATLDELL